VAISEIPGGNLNIESVTLLERECQLRILFNAPLGIPGIGTQSVTYNWRAADVLPAKIEGDFERAWDVFYDLLYTFSVLSVTFPPQGSREVLLHLAPANDLSGMRLLEGLSCVARRLRELTGMHERRDLDERYDMFIEYELPDQTIVWRRTGELAIESVLKDILTAFALLGLHQEETHG